LNAVALVSPTDGWAVGENRTILRLQGTTWSLYTNIESAIPSNVNLRALWVVSPNEVWAAGDGYILRYTVP
jgi:hypothetical protein